MIRRGAVCGNGGREFVLQASSLMLLNLEVWMEMVADSFVNPDRSIMQIGSLYVDTFLERLKNLLLFFFLVSHHSAPVYQRKKLA